MFYFSLFIYFFGYLLFTYSVFKSNYVRLSYLFGVYIFLSLQFGPHTAVFHEILELTKDVNTPNLHAYYNFVVGSSFIVFGFFFIVLPKKIRNGPGLLEQRIVKPHLLTDLEQHKVLFYSISMVLILISISLQPGLKVTVENLKFFSGTSFFSYTEIRRVLFSDTAWGSYSNLVRFTVLPLVFGYFIALSILCDSKNKSLFYFLFAVFLILVVGIQLNKFFYLYYIILYFFIKSNIKASYPGYVNVKWLLSKLPRLFLFACLFLFSVLTLYKIQYADALSQQLITENDIIETLIFRVFFASSDSLRLWIDYFFIKESPMGGAVINSICHLFDRCFNPNTFIPYYYLDRDMTSMQAGFMGTALGVGGIYFVPLFSLLVCFVITFNCKVLNVVQVYHAGLFVFISPIMLINSFFLTTRELHTASLSGGALFISCFIILIILVNSLKRRS